MIDFTRAFESAWERMVIILFRPFDLAKWFVMGLSAFLAGLIAGGNGVNGSFNTNSFSRNQFQAHSDTSASASGQAVLQQFNTQIGHFFSGMAMGMIVALFLGIFFVILALSLLFIWLGARGQFMFLDNIVRNRAEIAWPWKTYARQANNFFLVYLLLQLVLILLIVPIVVVAVVISIPLFHQQRWPAGAEIGEFIALGLLYLLIGIGAALVLFLYRELGIPIMFRQGISAGAALTASLKLIQRFPGSICVFILLRFALFIGTAVVCAILCCMTCCCLYNIPYVGTVFLLPVLVYLRCFTLDCLAQFGPEYDVWTVDVAPALAGQGLPPSPPPPHG